MTPVHDFPPCFPKISSNKSGCEGNNKICLKQTECEYVGWTYPPEEKSQGLL